MRRGKTDAEKCRRFPCGVSPLQITLHLGERKYEKVIYRMDAYNMHDITFRPVGLLQHRDRDNGRHIVGFFRRDNGRR